MAGIYLHIPFCKQACNYCNFHFSTSLKHKNDVLAALLKEAALQREYLAGQEIHTIYFGGGTPSLLSEAELNSIFEVLYKHYNIQPGAEITLEANPDDLNADKLTMLAASPVNRLSVGIQSFIEADLQYMNRAHNAAEAYDSLKRAQDYGFSNMSADLIYGTPTLTDAQWEHNMNTMLELGIPHISCYALTVEDKTALDSLIAKGKMQPVHPEDAARQFTQLMSRMAAAGYEHYEISNFALPGKRSRHNSSYWQGLHYLGLGPSAHSFNTATRQWNIANNALYTKALLIEDRVPFETEVLSDNDRYNEYVMTALRTMEGIDMTRVTRQFGPEAATALAQEIAAFVTEGKVQYQAGNYSLTPAGMLFADGIASDLFRIAD
jgi:oxygen-independent coproporphyrinogen-3 oxidase